MKEQIKGEKDYFNEQKACDVPICWSKYTIDNCITVNFEKIQHGIYVTPLLPVIESLSCRTI